jgi:hypothetical protein
MIRPRVYSLGLISLLFALAGFPLLGAAQSAPTYSPQELDRLVSRIALYPDPLLTQILTASTYGDQIPDAARWADEHHYLTGEELARAIADDKLSWDPSVQALLPFSSVLDMMASDIGWTNELGNAVLAERQDVMDAIQRMRRKARDYGYLRSNADIIVSDGPFITIMPVNPAFIIVPYYDPLIVFAPPRPGFVVAGAIHFGFGVTIGTAFQPWGWGTSRIDWGSHTIIINEVPWDRTWFNRLTYVHEYGLPHYEPSRRVEGHALIPRSAREREAERRSQSYREEHHHR